MTCENPLASGYPTAVQLSRRSSRCVVSDSDSDPDSDPVTRYRTCGLCEKKLILSNTQICLGEYQENRLFFNLRFVDFQN